MKGLLFTMLGCCLLASCTITKRHFGSGYHIEWKRNPGKVNGGEERQDYAGSKVQDSENTNGIESSVAEIAPEAKKSDSIRSVNPEIVKVKDLDLARPQIIEAVKPVEQKISPEERNEPDSYNVPKKTEPFTWVSLALFIGIGISIGLISMFSSFLYLGAGALIGGLVLVMFLFSLTSFVRIRRAPHRYENKGLTKFLFFLSLICIVITAIYLLTVVAVASMSPMMQGV